MFSIIGLMLLAAFYGSYFTKVFSQSMRGIKTNRLGKGGKSKRTFIIEIILKAATVLTAVIQLISILLIGKLPIFIQNACVRYIGLAIAAIGVGVFITAMVTMRDSWRAGIDNTQETKFVKTGIYKYSRNPAFVGFDLFYTGLALGFSNGLNVLFACISIIMLHFQILEEEKFLTVVFGSVYVDYKNKIGRYFGAE